MNIKVQLFICSVILTFNAHVIINGENILVVMPMLFPSHLKSLIPLAEQLIKNGHNLTVISVYPITDDVHTKYHHVQVKTKLLKDNIEGHNHRSVKGVSRMNRFTFLKFMSEFYYHYSEEVLNSPELQRFSHSQDHYDLVIAELFYMDVFFAFGYKFKAPVVALCTTDLMFFYSWILGNPYPSSYVPNQILWYTDNMPLLSRISNMVFNVYCVLYHEWVSLPRIQTQMEKFFNFDGNEVPKMKDIMKNISLVLVNSHYSLGYIKPELPNIINVAGSHYSSFEPLPLKMKKFTEEANHGFIYLSMGSIVQPQEFRDLGNIFVRELKNFPQRVIMKWDSKMLDEIPHNILVEEWIVQTQVLNHPNCRLFITHGGLYSTLESINASVPLLGIPVFSDQYYNMAAAEHHGIGRTISLDDVSVRLSAEIKEILNNPKYKENMMKRSLLFRERLANPLDEAVYWVEHVMKHKTTAHLKAAAIQLSWYEFYSLDIFTILLIMILSTLLAMKLFIAWILRSLHRIINLNISINQNGRKQVKND